MDFPAGILALAFATYVLVVSVSCFGLFAWDKYCAIRDTGGFRKRNC